MMSTHGQTHPDERDQEEQGQDEKARPADTGARPDEILHDGVDGGASSDEEAVLAYNANAEDGDPEQGVADEE